MPRKLSPYEYNHLVKYGHEPASIDRHGEMPVEYITGYVEFCGHEFVINEQALIPRIETEELVELAFKKTQELLQSNSNRVTIADVGTGSGAIAISLFLKLINVASLETKIDVYMSDVSNAALKVAQTNIDRLVPKDFTSRLHLFESDLFSQFPVETTFDVIVSNLPYIPTGRISSLESSVKDFEPTVALDGGIEGLTLIQTMLSQVHTYLKPNGVILLEIDYTHTPQELIAQAPLLQASVITDQFLRQRFAIIRLK
jgi:release factor glutamine methyltransferase